MSLSQPEPSRLSQLDYLLEPSRATGTGFTEPSQAELVEEPAFSGYSWLSREAWLSRPAEKENPPTTDLPSPLVLQCYFCLVYKSRM